MTADILTKGFQEPRHKSCVQMLGLSESAVTAIQQCRSVDLRSRGGVLVYDWFYTAPACSVPSLASSLRCSQY